MRRKYQNTENGEKHTTNDHGKIKDELDHNFLIFLMGFGLGGFITILIVWKNFG